MKTHKHMLSATVATSLLCCCLFSSAIFAQQYLNMRQDGRIYDIDVIIFARALSQPPAQSVSSKPLLKSDSVNVLPTWDGTQELLQFPPLTEQSSHSVPINNQANPVKVLSDLILSNSMDHPIVNRLSANPTFKPLYRQKWRQAPSQFTQPKYIEVSNLPQENQINGFNSNGFNSSGSNTIAYGEVHDYKVDGQMAFSMQRYTHLHVKMNLFRNSSDGEQIIYELSQQKRIELDQWQYFDHQQFGVLAKVTTVKLNPEE